MIAYSDTTGRTYPSWEDLVTAESHGYLVIVIFTKKEKTWPWVTGLYHTKVDADRARARMRNRLKREARLPQHEGIGFSIFVRPAWKEKP